MSQRVVQHLAGSCIRLQASPPSGSIHNKSQTQHASRTLIPGSATSRITRDTSGADILEPDRSTSGSASLRCPVFEHQSKQRSAGGALSNKSRKKLTRSSTWLRFRQLAAPLDLSMQALVRRVFRYLILTLPFLFLWGFFTGRQGTGTSCRHAVL